MTLTSQTILVSGAGGGIGRTVVEELKAAGATVVAADINAPADTGADHAVACDVTSEESCAAAIEEASKNVGPITGLSYISGVLQAAAPITELSDDEWDLNFNVNLRGFVRLSKLIIPGLDESSAGLVGISSWWGHAGQAYFAAYCASKAALKITIQSMAAELAPKGIRVNSVAPGNIDTSMHRKAISTEADKRGITADEMLKIEWEKIPMGYAGPPKSIADAVVFLHSPASSYITGATIDVNGGVMLR